MERPAIIVFDVETTGTDPERDQIIELALQQGLEETSTVTTWRIRPTVSISPEAQAVHGITTDDLAACPTFDAYADEIRRRLNVADVLVGYNVSFDIQMLQAEFSRLRQPPLDLAGKCCVDPYRLWQRYEPRTLDGAHQRFVGAPLEGAHGAAADTTATARVLLAMLDAFCLRGNDWQEVATICEPERSRWIGPSHHVQWHDGVPVIAFGRHKGASVSRLAAENDGDYLRWMLRRDFPRHVDLICSKALELDADALRKWLVQAFGSPSGSHG